MSSSSRFQLCGFFSLLHNNKYQRSRSRSCSTPKKILKRAERWFMLFSSEEFMKFLSCYCSPPRVLSLARSCSSTTMRRFRLLVRSLFAFCLGVLKTFSSFSFILHFSIFCVLSLVVVWLRESQDFLSVWVFCLQFFNLKKISQRKTQCGLWSKKQKRKKLILWIGSCVVDRVR